MLSAMCDVSSQNLFSLVLNTSPGRNNWCLVAAMITVLFATTSHDVTEHRLSIILFLFHLNHRFSAFHFFKWQVNNKRAENLISQFLQSGAARRRLY